MNYISLINAATMGHPRRVLPLILWTMLEYFLRGAPYGIVLAAVWEILVPLQQPGTPLNTTRIAWACLGLLLSLLLLYLAGRKAYFASYRDSYAICAEGRLRIAEHLRRLPMGFYNSRDPGDIGAYIVSDYASVENMLSHQLPAICGGLVGSLVLLIILACMSWQLALAAALVIPFAWALAMITYKIVTYFGKKHQKFKVEAASRLIEYIQGIRLIKAFNLVGSKFSRLDLAFHRLKVASIRLEAGTGPTLILASFVLHGGYTLIILAGFSMLLAGTVSLPVYVMFLILGPRLYEPLLHAMLFTAELNYYKLGVERIEALRQAQPLPQGRKLTTPSDMDIEFRHVRFSYQQAEVLRDISLHIPARSLTALVGPSGSGKTTLTRLIARFWDVDGGEIRMGGSDIRDHDPDHLLVHISMVFQDVYLFNDTIANNIRIGRQEASEEEMIAAARAARCHDFIMALPQGYDTLVGEGGSTLSGGEKQRISIARALLKDAPIVLLDEATAALDPENELHIQAAIGELVRDKTVVVIAHRLNTITRADKIVVLDQGRVAEEGRHEELLQRGGLYQNLWEEQQRLKGWKF